MTEPTKGRLEKWSLILGLPVALVSIASVVIPPAWSWVKGDYSELDITLAYSDFEKMELLVTNVGNRAAILTRVELDASTKGDADKSFFRISEKHKVIKAGGQFLFNASNGTMIHASTEQLDGVTDLPKKVCSVVVKYRQYNSKEESTRYKFDCYAIDHSAVMRIANLSKAGVNIPWPTFIIRPDGAIKIPNSELFKWANSQPLTREEASHKPSSSTP